MPDASTLALQTLIRERRAGPAIPLERNVDEFMAAVDRVVPPGGGFQSLTSSLTLATMAAGVDGGGGGGATHHHRDT